MAMSPLKFGRLMSRIGLSAGIVYPLISSAIAPATGVADMHPAHRMPSDVLADSSQPESQPPVVVDTIPPEAPTTPTTSPTTTSGSTGSGSTGPISQNSRFSCQLLNGQYTVMYHPQSQPNQSFAWATPSGLGGGWDSERRCNEISRRLESYRPDGLQEMRTAVQNNYNTVCVTTQSVAACRIVLTVPPGQDPTSTRDRVFQNLTVADSGQQTQAVNTFVNGGNQTSQINQLLNLGRSILGGGNHRLATNSIDLRPFLDRADGGTGTKLQGGVPTRTAPRLNPGNFR